MTDRALTLAPSSNVASASYDDEMMTLTVVFYSGGGTYVYQGVNRETAMGLESAPSPGGFIHRFVKGRFPST